MNSLHPLNLVFLYTYGPLSRGLIIKTKTSKRLQWSGSPLPLIYD